MKGGKEEGSEMAVMSTRPTDRPKGKGGEQKGDFQLTDLENGRQIAGKYRTREMEEREGTRTQANATEDDG